MSKPITPQATSIEPYTPDQIPHLESLFGALIRTSIGDTGKDGVQKAIEAWGSTLEPAIRPLLLRASGKIPTRKASRLDLLRECKQAGIKLWGATPEEANYGKPDPKVDYEVLPFDLDPIFALRDANHLPWNGDKNQQDAWAKGGLARVQQTLQAILDYKRVYGTVPDPNRYWWLRCSDPYGSGCSLGVSWDPGRGLYVYFVYHNISREDGGALPREVPALGV